MTYRDLVSSWVVLIVDDEPDSIEIAAKMLRHNGATVQTASDGQQAIELLEDLRPTFILADLSMPNVDGWKLLRHIRDKPELADIPVIALTAHAMKGDATNALGAGFTAYLIKPLSMFTLIGDILEALSTLSR